jgi:hypothetical protein
MKKVIKKLLMGVDNHRSRLPTGSIDNRINNIKTIWNNHNQDDVGIEKLFRLFLAASQFIFLGIYIKHVFGKYGSKVQDVSMDCYIILKVIFPLILVYYQLTSYPFLMLLVIWFMLETILYVPSLIFASDTIASPSSYRRSMLLLFFNYFELIFGFAFIYVNGHYLNLPFKAWYEPIYFSFTTMATIGFGDYYPVTGIGKLLVCIQSMLFLAFVVLFINYFSNRVEATDYFDSDKNDIK